MITLLRRFKVWLNEQIIMADYDSEYSILEPKKGQS